MRIKRRPVYLMCLIFMTTICLPNAFAMQFGRNDLRMDTFNWEVASSENFDIYYYPEEENVVDTVAQILEASYDKLSEKLEYTPDEKFPFFLYLTHPHFEQNRISSVGEGTGGFSESLRNRFVVPYSGSQKELEHVLTHELTHIFTFSMWYSGFWKTGKLMFSFFIPLWIQEGLAEYCSKEWDSDDDMVIRDAVIHNRIVPLRDLHGFSHMEGHDVWLAYKEGHSALEFMAERYGTKKVPYLIKEIGNTTDIDASLKKVIGCSLTSFQQEWTKYLDNKYKQQTGGKIAPEKYAKRLTQKQEFNCCPRFTDDGKSIAYMSDRYGYNDIFLTDIESGKTRQLLKKSIGRKIDRISSEGNPFDLSGNRLVFIAVKDKRQFLCTYDIQKHRLRKYPIPVLACMRSPVFTPDGRILISAMESKVHDLYLFDPDPRKLSLLWQDEFDKDCPSYSDDGNYLAWQAERNYHSDIFVLDLNNGYLESITNSSYEERKPVWDTLSSEPTVTFIADYNGIPNLYYVKYGSTIPVELTDVPIAIIGTDISQDGNFCFSYFENGEQNVYHARRNVMLPGIVTKVPLEPETTSILKHGETTIEKINLDFKDYRPRPGTELFIPFFLYSSDIGFMTYTYWQGSDITAHNRMSVWLEWYQLYNRLNYSINYSLLRFPVQMDVLSGGLVDRYIDRRDYLMEEREFLQGIRFTYPISERQRISAIPQFVLTQEKNIDLDTPGENKWRDGIAFSYVADFTEGKFLDISQGWCYNISVYNTARFLGSDMKFGQALTEIQDYIRLGERFIWANRIIGEYNWGRDKEQATIATLPVRGYEYNSLFPVSSYLGEYEGDNRFENTEGDIGLAASTELRYYLWPHLNANVWFMWPSIYLKSAQGIAFVDAGTLANRMEDLTETGRIFASYGVGIRINTFVLSQFTMIGTLYYAVRMENGAGRFCYSFGTYF